MAEYAKEYFSTCAVNLSHNTQVSYKRILDKHILPALGKVKLTDLNHRQVQRFVTSLSAQKGLSAKTVRNIHGVLHNMLESAVRDELLLRNVSERCSLPRVTQHQVRAITTAELSRFLQAIDGKQFRNIFFIDIFSGLRLSEILGLRWDDILWEKNSIVIRQQLQQKHERGAFDYYLTPPKENKQRCIVLPQAPSAFCGSSTASSRRKGCSLVSCGLMPLIWCSPMASAVRSTIRRYISI